MSTTLVKQRAPALARQVREALGQVADTEQTAPARAVGAYAAGQLQEAKLDDALLGLEQLLTAYSAPLPPMVVEQLGAVAAEVRQLQEDRRQLVSPSARTSPSAPPASLPVRRPRRPRRPRRGSTQPPPAAPEPTPPTFDAYEQPMMGLMPVARPVSALPPEPTSDSGGWMLLGLLGLGLGVAAYKDRGSR